jgi:hypothetical protein
MRTDSCHCFPSIGDKNGILMRTLILGALAGLAATMSMTATMHRMHRRLPDELRYPLPPREIVDRTIPTDGDSAHRNDASPFRVWRSRWSHVRPSACPARRRSWLWPWRLGRKLSGMAAWLSDSRARDPTSRPTQPANACRHVVWGVTLAKCLAELKDADQAFGRFPLRPRRTAEHLEMDADE